MSTPISVPSTKIKRVDPVTVGLPSLVSSYGIPSLAHSKLKMPMVMAEVEVSGTRPLGLHQLLHLWTLCYQPIGHCGQNQPEGAAWSTRVTRAER
ncbi:MAG TPA: hypothetical protein VGU21_04420, partial [Streptosporangiaceae bacterium]|nr:hypothetical protein [Streptosporangiaceae bacterium]